MTTRPEDIAYSLLEIFNISMPLLCGEGKAEAFQRLQLEIMEHCDDESLFMWQIERHHDPVAVADFSEKCSEDQVLESFHIGRCSQGRGTFLDGKQG
jgi:hypothetical protein